MASKTPILIVEDEHEIGDLVRLHLHKEGYQTALVESGEAALKYIDRHDVALVVLDLMLPGIDGQEVCRQLKWNERTRHIPIVMLTARGEESDIVSGLELGADDYMVKPFSAKVLIARIRKALSRSQEKPVTEKAKARTRIGGIEIDGDRYEVRVDEIPVSVTSSEFQILSFLASRPGFVRTREQIIEATHGPRVVMSNRTVDVHITSLRRKLGAAGDLIETVRGVGYRLEDSSRVASR
ncbi:MAG: response regulator transcription factor [Phycisphaerales bacterium]|nr:response regulator transcription factor [Phycisphaerales bacterium]